MPESTTEDREAVKTVKLTTLMQRPSTLAAVRVPFGFTPGGVEGAVSTRVRTSPTTFWASPMTSSRTIHNSIAVSGAAGYAGLPAGQGTTTSILADLIATAQVERVQTVNDDKVNAVKGGIPPRGTPV